MEMKAALHSLANIAGETRMGNNVFLTSVAEENLKSLIYDKASKTPKLIPSVSHFFSLLCGCIIINSFQPAVCSLLYLLYVSFLYLVLELVIDNLWVAEDKEFYMYSIFYFEELQ